MTQIPRLLDIISQLPDCEVLPEKGAPSLPEGYALPNNLSEFYARCGGVTLYRDSAYGISIVCPNRFVRANPVIRGESGETDISYHWFILGQSEEQFITIDLNPLRLGRCYDSFWDRHACPGSCPIISNSFSELLAHLVESRGAHWYWLAPSFRSLGDAYGVP
jgi:hypothetical protein